MQNNADTQTDEPGEPPAAQRRKFLVIVDDSPECSLALRFAARRAYNTRGGVTLLSVVPLAEFQHWLGVGDLMKQESREEAEEMCSVVADVVKRRTGKMPIIYIREGQPQEVLSELIEEVPELSVLVLGASTGGEGPGPIVDHIVNKVAGGFSLPITIVPGGLSDEEIDAIT